MNLSLHGDGLLFPRVRLVDYYVTPEGTTELLTMSPSCLLLRPLPSEAWSLDGFLLAIQTATIDGN